MPRHLYSADLHRADGAAGADVPGRPRGQLGRWFLVVSVVLAGHLAAFAWFGLHRMHAAEPPAKTHVVVALLKATRIATASSDAPVTAAGDKRPHPSSAAQRGSVPAPARPGALQGITPPEPPPATSPNRSPNTAPQPTPATDARQTEDPAPQHAPPPSMASAANEADTGATAASATAALAAASGTSASATGVAGSGSGGAPGGNAANSATVGGEHGAGSGANDGERYALMPSSDLVYDTFYNGAQNQSGTLHWRTNGKQYQLVVSMPVPFVGTYSFISEGHIDAFGLAPDVYTEHRGRRGTDISRFLRDGAPHQVAFTRTPQTVPLPDGAQDRFSMIFQLASLVRGNPQRYRPGVTREFDVIDSNSAEIWSIQTIGPDTVVRPDGPIQAIHFMRLPRRAGDDRRIDIWLAPALDWIPVRIMQTEPNGTQIELLYHNSVRMPPTSVRLAPSGAVSASPASTAPGTAGSTAASAP